jgi:leucyl/phenylalanyl-tRNA--protein transferase
MPTEPAPTRWRFPPVELADEHGIVAAGGDLQPGTLVAAYRHGIFPMPIGADGPMGWWSPDPRAVLPLAEARCSRSLRRSTRRYEVRLDTEFEAVIDGCADPRRPGAWITDEIRTAYLRLHELGWAHSIEAWDADGLAGGLYGVAIGGLFAGESMFHRRTDASKVALVGLVEVLRSDGDRRRLLDVQWATEHLQTLGVVEVRREDYLTRLRRALEVELPAVWR